MATYVNDDYGIGKAFARIEEELISSMSRNMKRHRVEEVNEGKEWSMWQVEQLKALEKYKIENQKKYGAQFKDINRKIDELLRQANQQGSMTQEKRILQAIKKGWKVHGTNKSPSHTPMAAEFFKLNDRKLETLISATTHDMTKAETAVLRMANDKYRKIIYDAQVYANTGAGTYEKAIDMATKDFLSAGLNCIEYKNGARHTISDYADMAVRTAGKRAYLQGEGTKRQEWGIHTVIMNKRGNPCPLCLPFCGKILIDDVWSSGTAKEAEGSGYRLMSTAIEAGLYHPRCKDSHTTYFPGISTPPNDVYSKEELAKVEKQAKEEAKQQYTERQEEKFERLEKYSLDEENVTRYSFLRDRWKNVRLKTGGMSSNEYEESKRPLANFHPVPQNKVVNVLRKDSEEWISTLTDKEKHAIRKYTYNSGDRKPNRFFERLNAMLRGDLPEDDKLIGYADTISGALKKNKLKHDVIVYRGMDIDPTKGCSVGNIITPGQFYSTSVIDSRSFNSAYQLIIYTKKGSDAAYIEELSHLSTQRELLLDKDCYYRVLSRKGNIIELEVI